MTRQDFSGKVVVVTGGSSGIGLALAKQFTALGARVVIAGSRADRLEQAATQIRATGGTVDHCVCDVSDRAQVEALAEFTWRTCGRADVIVNNAGIGPVASSVIDAKPDDVRRVFDVNFFGTWHGISVFGRRMIAQGTPAAIYNLGSENCFFNAVPGGTSYIATKHALLAVTMALRAEVPDFIDVGLICPGLVHTGLGDLTRDGMDADVFAAAAMKLMLAREFFITTHAYNVVRVLDRHREIEDAYAKNAPRYEGDDEYDVRTIAKKQGWWSPEVR